MNLPNPRLPRKMRKRKTRRMRKRKTRRMRKLMRRKKIHWYIRLVKL